MIEFATRDVIINMRHNPSKEIITFSEQCRINISDDTLDFYMWDTGNFVCDCNRRILWCNNHNTKLPELDDNKCGYDEFDIQIYELTDSYPLYDEFVSVADKESTLANSEYFATYFDEDHNISDYYVRLDDEGAYIMDKKYSLNEAYYETMKLLDNQ